VTHPSHDVHRRRDLVDRFGERAIRVALRDGLLEQPWRGVLIASKDALCVPVRAAAALLVVGDEGVLSHQTAAALHGCTAVETPGMIHLTVPYSCRVRGKPGLFVHRDRFDPADVTTRDGLRVFRLEQALVELLCSAPRRDALACLDQALGALATEARGAFRDELSYRLDVRDDQRGTKRARVLLGLASGKADSPPESWLRLLVADAGFPAPEPQVKVRDLAGRLVYVLDLAWPEPRIALEYDGYEAHEGRAEADTERDHRLAGRGWIVIRARAADLSRPARLITELRAAFVRRGCGTCVHERETRVRRRATRA
jgi:hypothetical protein